MVDVLTDGRWLQSPRLAHGRAGNSWAMAATGAATFHAGAQRQEPAGLHRADDSEERERARKEAERPLGSYTALTTVFALLCGGFAAWMRRSGRRLPERVGAADLALVTVATHKLSRLITKDRVTSALRHPFTRYQEDAGAGEVEEEARGSGMRRAIGELLICPYCIGMWIVAAFTAGLAVAPRPTRWIASALSALFGSDVLQVAYRKLEDSL
jgi:hypothetical protein